jgi:hypothetical protein
MLRLRHSLLWAQPSWERPKCVEIATTELPYRRVYFETIREGVSLIIDTIIGAIRE